MVKVVPWSHCVSRVSWRFKLQSPNELSSVACCGLPSDPRSLSVGYEATSSAASGPEIIAAQDSRAGGVLYTKIFKSCPFNTIDILTAFSQLCDVQASLPIHLQHLHVSSLRIFKPVMTFQKDLQFASCLSVCDPLSDCEGNIHHWASAGIWLIIHTVSLSERKTVSLFIIHGLESKQW